MADLLLSLREILRRRWITFVVVAGLITSAGIALLFIMTPQYTATASVQIDPSLNPLSDNATDQAKLNPEAIETQVSILRSVELARQVASKLDLVNDPELAGAMQEMPNAGDLSEEERNLIVAAALLAHLDVERQGLTYIIAIQYTSTDPVKSARIANAFANGYIAMKAGSQVNSAQEQGAWLQNQLADLAVQVKEADAAVANYRARSGLAGGSAGGGGSATIVDQQIGPLTTALATADSEAAAARANLEAAQQQIAAGGLDAVAQVRTSNVIADLRRQRAEALQQIGEIQARYGDRHPESLRVRDQLAAIDKQIRDEANRVISSLRAEAVATEARAASLRQSLNKLEQERAVNTRASVIADSMEREATAKRQAYDRLLELSLSNTQAEQNTAAQAVIVDQAQPPLKPSSPNKPLIAALSLIAGLLGGACVVALQEMMGTGMRTIGELERALGVPVLAAIPTVSETENPADLLLERPTSLFAESLRIARASILGVKSGTSSQVVALTSALPSEGKTTTALSFARTLASNGSKTLLLECDVRRAAIRALLPDATPSPGIVEYLHGEAELSDCIRPSNIEGLDQLLVREPFFSSEDLFGDGKMEEALAQLRQDYRHIVLDLPPLVGLADGRFLAVLADVTALIVRWNTTPASAASSALQTLAADGANPVGSIYTMVDASAEAIGGLYYSKKYGTYYQTQS